MRNFGFANVNRNPLPANPQDIKSLVDELNKETPSKNDLELNNLVQPQIDPRRFEIKIDGYTHERVEQSLFTSIDDAIRKQVTQLTIYKNFREFEKAVAKDYGEQCWIGYGSRQLLEAPFLQKHNEYINAFISAANKIGKKKVESVSQFIDSSGNLRCLTRYKIRNADSRGMFCLINENSRHELGVFAEQVFDSLRNSLKAGLNKLSSLQNYVKKVALLEWLNAHRWYYPRGSAGVAHMITRVFLDAAKISNGSYRENLDPNMEAFITSVRSFVENFHNFFAEPLELQKGALIKTQTLDPERAVVFQSSVI